MISTCFLSLSLFMLVIMTGTAMATTRTNLRGGSSSDGAENSNIGTATTIVNNSYNSSNGTVQDHRQLFTPTFDQCECISGRYHIHNRKDKWVEADIRPYTPAKKCFLGLNSGEDKWSLYDCSADGGGYFGMISSYNMKTKKSTYKYLSARNYARPASGGYWVVELADGMLPWEKWCVKYLGTKDSRGNKEYAIYTAGHGGVQYLRAGYRAGIDNEVTITSAGVGTWEKWTFTKKES